ncbi:MAG: hypothetical protein J1E59_03155 [Treponema sp.]|nr:hypothetical protein [Treponema sp.]
MSKKKSHLKTAYIGLIAIILSSLLSCSKKFGNEIELDASDPLATAPDVQWALVVVPYASFKKDTSWNSQTAGYCKQGECFPILARSVFTVEGKTENWYRFEEGWLPENMIKIYANKLRAEKAAQNLK